MQSIVINTCYGGFGLSVAAMNELKMLSTGYKWVSEIPRDDKHLVDVVRRLGEAANGEYAKLEVVEIPDGVEWHIHEYDGNEHVAENHRTWA